MYIASKILSQTASKPGNRNHIWIYDRSGSMTSLLPALGKDLIELCGHVKPGDTLTLSWFSSEGGQFRTVLKGYLFTGNGDSERIAAVINANISPVAMTCFSEVLADTVDAIAEVKAAFPNNTFALSFFTDGCPVVSDYTGEVSRIFGIIAKLRPIIGEALFIGYGDYYNRRLMAEMTNEIGGTLVHADQLVVYKNEMKTLITSQGAGKIVIDLTDITGVTVAVYGTGSGQIVIYPVDGHKLATVSDMEKEIFVITDSKPPTVVTDESTIYAGAYVLASQGRVDEAIDWLAQLGDKGLIDRLYSAFTDSEIGEAVEAIRSASKDVNLRYLEGKRKKYVPKYDAFCLIDALDALAADPDACFFPTSKAFTYKRIGAATVKQEGYPDFVRDENNRCRFGDLTWNKDRLNLSILARITGHIQLRPDCKVYGLDETFNSFQWRNYTIVKDGILNVRWIPVQLGTSSFIALKEGGLLPKKAKFEAGAPYLLDLKRVPIINRKIAEGNMKAAVLATAAMDEQNTMAVLKVLGYLRNQVDPDKMEIKETPFTDKYSPEQLRYLEQYGITNDGSYSPPVDDVDPTDFYEARTFSLKVSGWSSLPKMDEVLERDKNGSKLNAPAQAMMAAYLAYSKSVDVGEREKSVKFLDEKITSLKTRLKSIRTEIQRAKFAVILAHRWFDEFNGKREDASFTVYETEVKFVFGKQRIAY